MASLRLLYHTPFKTPIPSPSKTLAVRRRRRRLRPAMEQEAAAGWGDTAGGGHHLRQGGRGEDDHHRQRRPLPRPHRLLRRRGRLRRRPRQPGPPPRSREPRQLHGRRRPQRRVPPRPGLVRDKRWPHFRLLCISKPHSKLPFGFGGKALLWIVDSLKSSAGADTGSPSPSPDFILIDCPAGFITAITPANEAVLVTTPDITALRDADRVTGLLRCDRIKDIKMIVNRVRTDLIKGEDMMSLLDVQEMLGLALLWVIPEDSEVIWSTNRGYPLVLNKPPTLAGMAFEQAAWRLVEQDSMTAVVMDEEPKKRGAGKGFE